MPWRLPAFPKNHWLQVRRGEAILGFFRYGNGDDAVHVANHNAFAPQEMVLVLSPKAGEKAGVELLDRKTGQWRQLELKDAAITFRLEAAGGELLRVKGRNEQADSPCGVPGRSAALSQACRARAIDCGQVGDNALTWQ